MVSRQAILRRTAAVGAACVFAFGVSALVAQRGPVLRPVAPAAPAAGGFSITGSVYYPYPEVKAKATMAILTMAFDAPGAHDLWRLAPIAAGGTFSFDHVLPGLYRVGLQQNGAFDERAVEVTDHDVTAIKLPVVGRTPVAVHVRMDDGTTLPAPIWFRAQVAGQGLGGGVRNGSDSIFLPPGKTPLLLHLPNGYFVASIRSGTLDLLREQLDVKPAAIGLTVDAVLTRARSASSPTVTVAGQLRGDHPSTVVELENEAVFPAKVPAVTTTTNASGGFEFRGVPPGVYRLNIPPAESVVANIVAVGSDVTLDVPMSPGRIIAGGGPRILAPEGRYGRDWPGRISIVFDDGGEEVRFRIANVGFWGVLRPNIYRVRIDGLPARFTVASLRAGTIDLLRDPYVVLPDRTPPIIEMVLRTTLP